MNPLYEGLFIAFFGVALTAILAFLKSFSDRMRTVETALAKLDTQVSPLWAKVQAQIAADLHHPHVRYHEMDDLLEKLEALTIEPHERDRLKVLLVERSMDMHEDITPDQRAKAQLMISVMDMVLTEAGGDPAKATASPVPPPVVLVKTTVPEGKLTIIVEPQKENKPDA